MAIIPQNEYPGQILTGQSSHPYGKAQNVVTDGDGTGTPLEAKWVSEFFGIVQAFLDGANVTPNGTVEGVGQSQFLSAFNSRIGTSDSLTVDAYEPIYGAPSSSMISVAGDITGTATSACISDDGTKLYVLDADTTPYVRQFTMSTPYDLFTASYDTVSVSVALASGASRVVFKPDGSQFYVLGTTQIRQWALSTPWDLSTASANGSKTLGSEYEYNIDICWRPDGTGFYLFGRKATTFAKAVRRYTATTPWTVAGSNDAADELFSTSSTMGTGVEGGVDISADGRRLYVSTNDDIYEWVFDNTPYTTSVDYRQAKRDISSFNGNTNTWEGINFSPRGGMLILVSDVGANVAAIRSSIVRLKG